MYVYIYILCVYIYIYTYIRIYIYVRLAGMDASFQKLFACKCVGCRCVRVGVCKCASTRVFVCFV